MALKDQDDIIFDEEAEEKPMKGKTDKKLRKELKSCMAEKQEYLEGWQRAKADLINYKREAEEARQRHAKFASEDLIHQILPVLDSFEMALDHVKDRGVEQIYAQLLDVLKQNSVSQISPVGEKFNPNMHDSIGTTDVDDKKKDGIIVEVIQKGYELNGKLIRAPKVHVGKFKS